MAKAHCMVVARDPATGAVLTAATINVYTPGTVTPISATIFDKNNNVLSNPLTSDATTGLVDFYLTVAQEVDLVVSKSGYTTRTYSNVPVLDDASNDLSALLTTTGDVVYASGNNTPARLGIGSTGAFLTVSGGVPIWSNTIAAGGLTITAGNLVFGAANAVIQGGATNLNFNNNAGNATNLTIADGGLITIGRGNLAFTPAVAIINGGATSFNVNNNANNATNLSITDAGQVAMAHLGGFASGDKYVVIDASGNLHKSAIGPAS